MLSRKGHVTGVSLKVEVLCRKEQVYVLKFTGYIVKDRRYVVKFKCCVVNGIVCCKGQLCQTVHEIKGLQVNAHRSKSLNKTDILQNLRKLEVYAK